MERRRNGREKERMEEGGEKDEEHGEKERIEVNVRTLYVTWHDAHVRERHAKSHDTHACILLLTCTWNAFHIDMEERREGEK